MVIVCLGSRQWFAMQRGKIKSNSPSRPGTTLWRRYPNARKHMRKVPTHKAALCAIMENVERPMNVRMPAEEKSRECQVLFLLKCDFQKKKIITKKKWKRQNKYTEFVMDQKLFSFVLATCAKLYSSLVTLSAIGVYANGLQLWDSAGLLKWTRSCEGNLNVGKLKISNLIDDATFKPKSM